MDWSGAPAASFSNAGGTPAANPGLHVTLRNKSNDVGVVAAFARTLTYYAAKEGSSTLGTQAKNTAKGLLDRMLLLKESKGITVSETRGTYRCASNFAGSLGRMGKPCKAYAHSKE